MHKRFKQQGFHMLPIIAVLAVFALGGLIAWRVIMGMQHKAEDFGTSYGQNCKERDVAFTSPPLKMQDLNYIRPMGAMLDGHVTPTDHVYVSPANMDAADNTYPVLMPADGTVTEISRMPDQYIGDRKDVQLAAEDHRLVLSFSCRYSSIYIHIHKLADPLAKAVQGIKANENKNVSIDLKAGDTVGYIGGSTFDWTMVDNNTTLSGFITPDLYKREPWKIHTISPFDLYRGDLKTQMEAKSIRTVPPVGGKIDYDQRGKLVGTWFRSGTNGYEGSNQERYWDGHLSVVPDYIDPSYTIVSIGNWEGQAKQFAVKGSPNPATISEGTLAKFELIPLSYVSNNPQADRRIFTKGMHPDTASATVGTIAFQVQSGEKLKVEKFPGKSAAQVTGLTAAAETYER
ncbi:MAG TPA: hypothetical protein VLA88_06350 [Candidatus Saccharimonadales bacterium]|nr:hypothetical protein [Candidatus Saccharimonadales bacterium]